MADDLPPDPTLTDAPFPVAGGEMGSLMRSIDWSQTPVGPSASWPQSLRTAVSILLESKFAMMVAWGRDFTHFYNDAYRPILGSTKHPSLGRRVPDVFPEIWSTIGPLFEGVMQGTAVGFDDLMVPLDRHGFLEECYFTFSYSPIRDEQGNVGGVHVTVAETTARVLAERRLRTLRDLAAGAFQVREPRAAWRSVSDVLRGASADVAFALLYELLPDGGGARRVDNSDLPEAVAPPHVDLRAHTIWPLAEVIAAGAPRVVDDVRARAGDLVGRAFAEPVERAVVLPIARAGLPQPYGVLVAGVSPRAALDERYRDFFALAADQIATAVANARAHEEEARRVSALAELDRAKTSFFSNVSHELRTPLTLMLGPTEDLLSGAHGALTTAQRTQLELIRRNELRMQRLVNALLDFSRLEAGRIQATYEAVDLPTFTRDLASAFRAAIERAGLTFQVDCPPLDGPVFVDRDMWEQVVMNLLSNALKFTFEGAITVSLHDAGDHVALRIADTGVGIRPEDQARLFERFHRIEGTRARTHEGSGIGLALVQELVRLHGGTVTAESVHGVGTTFTARVPKGSAHLPPERLGRKVSGGSALGSAFVEEALRWLPGAPAPAASAPVEARVLVADDNADMRDYLRRALEGRFEVETVNDGAAALEAVKQRPPDVILTDVMMPILDGLRLARALKADPSTRAIPVVMLSARAGEESRVEGLQAGADDYLVKPFSARELIARVAAHVAASKVRRALEAEQARLRSLFENAPAMICVLRGPEHVFELANPLYRRLVGDRPAVGLPIREALPEIAGQGYFELLDAVYATGAPAYGSEARVLIDRGGDGRLEERFVNFVYHPDRGPDGAVEGVLVFGFDVTDLVLARRTAEDATRTAEAARRRAEGAVRAHEELLTIASHELRTPLTTLGLQIDGLLRGLEGPSATDASVRRWFERAGKVRAQASRLERLVDDMLDVVTHTRDRLSPACETVDLAAVASEAVERARRGSAPVELSGEPVVGHWDKGQVEQIVAQLLSTALEAGHGAPVRVRSGPDGEAAVLVVSGDDADPRRGLSRFADAPSADHYGGFGLGLWVVRALVFGLGGTLHVESAPERGAIFTVRLPRVAP